MKIEIVIGREIKGEIKKKMIREVAVTFGYE